MSLGNTKDIREVEQEILPLPNSETFNRSHNNLFNKLPLCFRVGNTVLLSFGLYSFGFINY